MSPQMNANKRNKIPVGYAPLAHSETSAFFAFICGLLALSIHKRLQLIINAS